MKNPFILLLSAALLLPVSSQAAAWVDGGTRTWLGSADQWRQVLFSDDELEVLVRISRYFRRPIPTSLNDYIVATARLGGYLQRKHDSPPGALVLAKGMTDLAGLALGFALAKLE